MFCSQCGYNLDASTQSCPSCGRDTGVRPDSALQATLVSRNSPAHASHVTYAGFWLRFVAWVLDEAILTGLGFFVLGRIVSLARVGSIFTGLDPSDDLSDWWDVLGVGAIAFYFIAFIVINWLYHSTMESSSWQGTLGKRALGIVVTDMNGAKLDFWRASGRFFSRLVSNIIPFGIGYAIAGFTQRKQALHDLIASTLVLHKPR